MIPDGKKEKNQLNISENKDNKVPVNRGIMSWRLPARFLPSSSLVHRGWTGQFAVTASPSYWASCRCSSNSLSLVVCNPYGNSPPLVGWQLHRTMFMRPVTHSESEKFWLWIHGLSSWKSLQIIQKVCRICWIRIWEIITTEFHVWLIHIAAQNAKITANSG